MGKVANEPRLMELAARYSRIIISAHGDLDQLTSTAKDELRSVCLAMNNETAGLQSHPEWWNHSCACDTCRSYGEPD